MLWNVQTSRVSVNTFGIYAALANDSPGIYWVDDIEDPSGNLIDGFEDGNNDDWNDVSISTANGSSWTADTTTVLNGAYAGKAEYGTQSSRGALDADLWSIKDVPSTRLGGEYTFWANRTDTAEDDFTIYWGYSGERDTSNYDPGRVFGFDINREVDRGSVYLVYRNGTNGGQNLIDTGFELNNNMYYQYVIRNVDFIGGSFDWEIRDTNGSTLTSGAVTDFESKIS